MQDHLASVIDAEGNQTDYTTSDRDLLTQESSSASSSPPAVTTHRDWAIRRAPRDDRPSWRRRDARDRRARPCHRSPLPRLDARRHLRLRQLGLLAHRSRLRSAGCRRSRGAARASSTAGTSRTDDQRWCPHTRIRHRREWQPRQPDLPGGSVATYGFDYADREESLAVDPGTGALSVVANAAYYPAGPLSGLTLGNGLVEARTYTSRYFPDQIQVLSSGTPVFDWSYGEDDVGNISLITDNIDASWSRSFGYRDPQYFLTSATGPWPYDLSWDVRPQRQSSHGDAQYDDRHLRLHRLGPHAGTRPCVAGWWNRRDARLRLRPRGRPFRRWQQGPTSSTSRPTTPAGSLRRLARAVTRPTSDTTAEAISGSPRTTHPS